MNRASPVDLRKALEAARAYTDAGILFVPVPVNGGHQLAETVALAGHRLEEMEAALRGNGGE
jgi:hypothetical protein